jgi:hypothetical protein
MQQVEETETMIRVGRGEVSGAAWEEALGEKRHSCKQHAAACSRC